ncbi:MAG: hypothetical protein ACOC0F_00890 [archaeon]
MADNWGSNVAQPTGAGRDGGQRTLLHEDVPTGVEMRDVDHPPRVNVIDPL